MPSQDSLSCSFCNIPAYTLCCPSVSLSTLSLLQIPPRHSSLCHGFCLFRLSLLNSPFNHIHSSPAPQKHSPVAVVNSLWHSILTFSFLHSSVTVPSNCCHCHYLWVTIRPNKSSVVEPAVIIVLRHPEPKCTRLALMVLCVICWRRPASRGRTPTWPYCLKTDMMDEHMESSWNSAWTIGSASYPPSQTAQVP